MGEISSIEAKEDRYRVGRHPTMRSLGNGLEAAESSPICQIGTCLHPEPRKPSLHRHPIVPSSQPPASIKPYGALHESTSLTICTALRRHNTCNVSPEAASLGPRTLMVGDTL